jgi:hypothetical protein
MGVYQDVAVSLGVTSSQGTGRESGERARNAVLAPYKLLTLAMGLALAKNWTWGGHIFCWYHSGTASECIRNTSNTWPAASSPDYTYLWLSDLVTGFASSPGEFHSQGARTQEGGLQQQPPPPPKVFRHPPRSFPPPPRKSDQSFNHQTTIKQTSPYSIALLP